MKTLYKILLISGTLSLTTTNLFAEYGFNADSFTRMLIKEGKKQYKDYVKQNEKPSRRAVSDSSPLSQEATLNPTRRSVSGQRLKYPINNRVLFSKDNCDDVIVDSAWTSCYIRDDKISSIIHYSLNGEDLRSGYIPRPKGFSSDKFYEDKRIPSKYRAYGYSYRKQKYDRGHARSYASSAYSKEMIYNTYSMINIWPQRPSVNRHTWIKAEKYERLIARKLGNVEVYNIADTLGHSPHIGDENILVPVGFYKVIYNKAEKFKECFYYRNVEVDPVGDKLRDHVVNCDKVFY